MLNDIIKKEIKKVLNQKQNTLNEVSYSAQKKQFNLKTDFLSDSNVNNHIELYEGYLKNFNKISTELEAADRSSVDSSNSNYRNLKNDETYNMNGAYLHELYFANICDNQSQINMDSLSYMRLNRDFGTFDDWQKDFIACSLSSRCGWTITYYNFFTQSYMNCSIDLHSKNVPAGMYPVIVMDMWQHAYYKDYLKDSKEYLVAMMKQLNWKVIEKRFERADKIANIVRGNQ